MLTSTSIFNRFLIRTGITPDTSATKRPNIGNFKEANMASIKIVRPNDFLNRARKIKIYLDGNKIGDTLSNEVKAFEIPSGTHVLNAKIDWCSSNKINFAISENETMKFELTDFAHGGRPGGFSILYKILFEPQKYLSLTNL